MDMDRDWSGVQTSIILVTHRAAIHTIEALGNWHPHLVSYVEQVVRAGQLHLRTVSRASAFKQHVLGAEQSNLSTRVLQELLFTKYIL